jgi:hypothetical protein
MILKDGVAALCDQAARAAEGHAQAATVAGLRTRLDQPLRVAIAGRVKAGKSTLLNALVGERLAPTDAGECTKVITWYQQGPAYQAIGHLRDGTSREQRFSREDGRLEIHLDGTPPSSFDRLEVRWPSARLQTITLIDTPGLESIDESTSARTAELLGIDRIGPADVDAVIYLMRHLHRRDAEFLEAFVDRSVPHPSPVNAVAVLSRTDEIGAGRLDALAAASTIAQRYANDRRIRAICAAVIPVAGLISETAVTLREDEVASLREISRSPEAEQTGMLLSVDRFSDPAVSSVPAHIRNELLARFGLFGVRTVIARLYENPNLTATDLSRELIDMSGIRQLTEVLDRHFTRRAQVLQARSVLAGLAATAHHIQEDDPQGATQLLSAIEELEATAHEFAELRLWQLLLSGTVELEETEREEIERLTADGEPHDKLDRPADHPVEDLQKLAIGGATRWRERSQHPLADRATSEVCEVVARSYEGIYQLLSADRR